MAVYREPPKCPQCGEPVHGKYRDESHLPLFQQTIGDTFIGWDWDGHKCKVDSAEWKFEKVKCTCTCHNYPEGMIKHCMPCCHNGYIEIVRE